MGSPSDKLYAIFENHLLNALVEEEGTKEFLNRVVQEYISQLGETVVIPHEHRASIEEDLRDEVLEMLRKKTYGHYSLKEFRRARSGTAATAGAPEKKSETKTAPSSGAADTSLASKLRLRRARRSS